MGQICVKNEMMFEKNNQTSQTVTSNAINHKQSVSKGSNQSQMEDSQNYYISRDIKITLKKNLSKDHDTEDEDNQNNENEDQLDDSQLTISHHRNNDQSMNDIPQQNNKIDKDNNDSSLTKSNSNKQTNASKKIKKSSKGSYIFTGTLGHNSYLDISSQSLRNNRAFTESEVMNTKKSRLVNRNIKQ